MYPKIESFLRQDQGERTPFELSRQQLMELFM
ncbi:MAG: hypothetical protein ACOVML_07480 [Burkholderiaceae bacterium]